MRVFVRLGNNSPVVVPVQKEQKVSELLSEALRRLTPRVEDKKDSEEFDVRLAVNDALLVSSDTAQDVLSDGDHVTIVTKSAPSPQFSDKSFPLIGHSHLRDVRWLEGVEEVVLDGESLTTGLLVKIGDGNVKVKLSDSAFEKIKKARGVIELVLEEKRTVYGINTGFGKFAKTMIEPDKVKELQENLIRSHASGVGQPISPKLTRMLLALRINTLAKGYSGVRTETVEQMLKALNANCLPWVPEKGTVGASGDLAPLSHQALGLMGEGPMWSPKTGWMEANLVLEAHNIKPIVLHAKEGIGLINGTQFICSFGSEALERAKMIAKQADIIAAITLEALNGTVKAYDKDIHAAKPHKGQQLVAGRLRSVLHSDVFRSEIAESHWNCGNVQDAYSLRCVPQVHGVVNDTIEFVNGIINTEMNSAADNPLVLAERNELISGGNFHGEYPAKVLDYLAIGIHELANISERRIERLVHPAYSGLPAFLVEKGGLNSGFMLPHCTAAALVSENKVLTHPSSVDSITTSAGQEDHVSMGGCAARKALTVVEHVETVLAIELYAACQALEFRRPLKTTQPLEAVYSLVRTVVKPLDADRFMSPDIEATTKLLREGKVWDAVEPFVQRYQGSVENKEKLNHY